MRAFLILGAMLIGVISAANTAEAGVKMFVRHEVSDYAAWHKSYEGFRTTQREMGVTAQAVYQSTDTRLTTRFRSKPRIKKESSPRPCIRQSTTRTM